MKIKTTTSLAGDGFSYRFGEVVEKEEFVAKVGGGWEMLCEILQEEKKAAVEKAVEPAVDETADAPVARQKAVKASKETR
jgi:hypothetical protein